MERNLLIELLEDKEHENVIVIKGTELMGELSFSINDE